MWIYKNQLAADNVSMNTVYEKARYLYCDIKSDTPGPSAEDFKVCKRCFTNLKNAYSSASVSEPQPSTSGGSRRKSTLEYQLPDIWGEGDFPSKQ